MNEQKDEASTTTFLSADSLPAPRLELRWHRKGETWHRRECAYNLVLPLREFDLRCENEDGEVVRKEKTIELGRTAVSGTRAPDCYGTIDTPFRDSAHAQWDAEVLRLPIYAVCDDKAMLYQPSK